MALEVVIVVYDSSIVYSFSEDHILSFFIVALTNQTNYKTVSIHFHPSCTA